MCLRLMDKMGCLDLEKVLMLEEPKWGIDVHRVALGLQPNLVLVLFFSQNYNSGFYLNESRLGPNLAYLEAAPW